MTVQAWLLPSVVLAIHGEQLAEHGGPAGIRDRDRFESALAPPQRQGAYEGREDIGTLAAAYAFAIAQERHFAAGNRRTALAAAELFLELNGFRLTATDGDCVVTMLGVADGTFSAKDLVDWFQANINDI
jgi:death-on-curing protein